MHDKIDVPASIKKRRVIYKDSLPVKALDFGLYAMLVLFPLYAASLFFLLDLKRADLSILSWVVLVSGCGFSLLLLCRTLQVSELREYRARADCRNRVRELVESKGWAKTRDSNSLLVARIRPKSWFSWYDQIIVIYLGDKVLLNAVSYSPPGFRSPIHVAKCRGISDRFAAEINAS